MFQLMMATDGNTLPLVLREVYGITEKSHTRQSPNFQVTAPTKEIRMKRMQPSPVLAPMTSTLGANSMSTACPGAKRLIADPITQLNNNALQFFLTGNQKQAIVLLLAAYETFQANSQLQTYPVSALFCLEDFGSFDFQCSDCASIESKNNALSRCKHCDPHAYSYEADTTNESNMDCGENLLHKETRAQISGGLSKLSDSLASSPSTAYCIYNRALILPQGQDDDSLLRFHASRTCSILLYNLALVHHNMGIYGGISAALWKALRLYEMSLDAIDRSGASWVDMEKLVMALLNNMGNIHAHLFHYENTRACMNNLKIVLAASKSGATLDEDYIFFFLNALFQAKELCFAPAA